MALDKYKVDMVIGNVLGDKTWVCVWFGGRFQGRGRKVFKGLQGKEGEGKGES